MSSPKFDISDVRSKFPALQQDQIYMDNAGGSQILNSVIETISTYLSKTNVQLGTTYNIGRSSQAIFDKGFELGAEYINASPDEVVYGASTTQLFRNLSLTLRFNPGDEIVLSTLEHEANIASWLDLARIQNLTIKWWTPSPTPTTTPKLTPESLTPLLSPKTRLVACTHCSNLLGTIHDVKALADTVHTIPGALICIDGVAYAPHRRIDVRALGVDFYALSWYKVYGPHIGMLYASRAAQDQHMTPLSHFFNPTATLRDKLALGSVGYELIPSIGPVIEYLDSIGSANVIAHEHALQSKLLDYLASRPDITVYGEKSSDPEIRVPTISFTVKGWQSKDVVAAVEKASNLGFRFGHAYSFRLVRDVLGLDPGDGVVRVSLVHYNTVEEVQHLIEKLEEIVVKR